MSDADEKDTKAAPAKPQKTYADILGSTRVTGELLSSGDENVWISGLPKEPEHHKYVVWLGCQVLRTVQLPETLNDIFTHLSVDHVSLGGPSNCCGIAHDRRGDTAIGEHLTRQTVKKFDAFTPEQMLYWCPSCDNHLRQRGEAFETETTKRRKSVVGFLAEFLTPDRLTVEVPLRIAIHTHFGFPEGDADVVSVREILSRIPKLEVITLPDIPDLGRHCNDSAVAKFGKDRFKTEMRNWIDLARREGAQRIVSLYHSCHRQMHQVQMVDAPEDRIGVDNYLTLIARAMGLPEREDQFARFTATGDVDKIMDALSDKLRKTGINKDLARRAINTHFGPDSD